MPINAPRSRTIVLTDAGTSPFSAALVDYDGTVGGGTSIPAPVFTTPSSIAADGTPQVGEMLTGIDGVASDATSYTRRWLLGSTVLTSSAAYTPSAVGTYRYETIATGPGGQTTSGSNITVAAAAVPAPAFTTQPTVSPSTGTAGTTTYTATPGAVTNGTVTSRAWSLNGSVISTGLTAAPASAGTLTYQEFATGAGGSAQSTVRQATVAAATVTPPPSTLDGYSVVLSRNGQRMSAPLAALAA
jgi:hypothetical protein